MSLLEISKDDSKIHGVVNIDTLNKIINHENPYHYFNGEIIQLAKDTVHYERHLSIDILTICNQIVNGRVNHLDRRKMEFTNDIFISRDRDEMTLSRFLKHYSLRSDLKYHLDSHKKDHNLVFDDLKMLYFEIMHQTESKRANLTEESLGRILGYADLFFQKIVCIYHLEILESYAEVILCSFPEYADIEDRHDINSSELEYIRSKNQLLADILSTGHLDLFRNSVRTYTAGKLFINHQAYKDIPAWQGIINSVDYTELIMQSLEHSQW